MSAPVNNGDKIFTLLSEYNARTGQPTGRTKPNVPSDPNYIDPIVDTVSCPLPGPVVIPTINILVVIGSGFALTIKLLYGIEHISRTTAGTWNVTDRIYDGVLFEVTTAPVGYTLKIEYGSSQVKQVNNVGVANTFIVGPFDDITKISIITSAGDYDSDWNPDYLI
jgi:hypothetical protein